MVLAYFLLTYVDVIVFRIKLPPVCAHLLVNRSFNNTTDSSYYFLSDERVFW